MRINSARKYALSFFKRQWTLDDYPIDLWRQWPGYQADESAPVVFVARIAGWQALVGSGTTEQEAISDLRRQFEDYRRMAERLPRPGTFVAQETASDLTRTNPKHDDHLISGVTDLDKRE